MTLIDQKQDSLMDFSFKIHDRTKGFYQLTNGGGHFAIIF